MEHTAISMATVIGPTPPGTGVIKPACSLAEAKWTSPTTRFPLDLVSSKKHRENLKAYYLWCLLIYFHSHSFIHSQNLECGWCRSQWPLLPSWSTLLSPSLLSQCQQSGGLLVPPRQKQRSTEMNQACLRLYQELILISIVFALLSETESCNDHSSFKRLNGEVCYFVPLQLDQQF